jgi:predicted phage-related endonuclease
MAIERRNIEDRNEWLKWRRQDYITASTVGALFGYHPFVSALKLYVAARGVEFAETDNATMRRGRLLEQAFPLAVQEERPQWTIESAKVYLRNPELKLGATPDFFIHNDPRGLGILQAKTTSAEIFTREWDQGNLVPDWIIDQVLVECSLADARFAIVGVLVDPYRLDLKLIDVPIDQQRLGRIVAAAKQFRDDVEAGREPAPDFGKDAEVIKALSPRETKGITVDLSGNNQVPDLLARRSSIRERIERDKADCEVIETELKYLIGDAEFATGLSGWRITYKIEPRKGYTVEPSNPRVLRILDRRGRETL